MTPERIVADLKVRSHADGLLASAAACAVAGVLVAAEEGTSRATRRRRHMLLRAPILKAD